MKIKLPPKVNVAITADGPFPNACIWSLQRSKRPNGQVYPLRWQFAEAVSTYDVINAIISAARAGNKSISRFPHIRIHPVL